MVRIIGFQPIDPGSSPGMGTLKSSNSNSSNEILSNQKMIEPAHIPERSKGPVSSTGASASWVRIPLCAFKDD